jgi:hypothetical protein
MLHTPKQIRVTRYKRHWAAYLDAELLVVTVYKQGAVAVKKLLDALFSNVLPDQ